MSESRGIVIYEKLSVDLLLAEISPPFGHRQVSGVGAVLGRVCLLVLGSVL